MFLEPFEITKLLRFESQLNCSVFPLLTDQVHNMFKILNLGVEFASDLAQVEKQSTVHCFQ